MATANGELKLAAKTKKETEGKKTTRQKAGGITGGKKQHGIKTGGKRATKNDTAKSGRKKRKDKK